MEDGYDGISMAGSRRSLIMILPDQAGDKESEDTVLAIVST